MLEYNICTLAIILFIFSIFYTIYSRLQKPLEIHQLSSHIPSVTNDFWSKIKFSINLGMKDPRELLQFYMELVQKTGPVVHYKLFGRSYVILNDPDDIKSFLSSRENIKKAPEYEFVKPWLNDGVLLSSGSKWLHRRKLLINALHLKNLEMYNISFNKNSKILVNKLLEASENNKEIFITDYVSLCSIDMISETIMGTEINAQEGKSIEYVMSIKKACRSIHDRVFKFWLWSDVIFNNINCGRTFYKSINVLHEFSNKIIKKKRMSLNTTLGIKKNESFIDIILNLLKTKTDYNMTDNDIREELNTFFFAAHETTTVSLSSALLLLGIYHDIQDKVRDELYEIFGDSDRDVTMKDLNAMRYLEAVIKESLRLYPGVPLFTRLLENKLQIKNYSIPPTTTIMIFPYIIHRNEDVFSNSEEFIPERFLDDENKCKFLSAYIPFSAGPRNCIGTKFAMNKMKIMLSTILRKTKIETFGNKNDIQISMNLALKLESSPNIKFYKI